MAAPIGNKFAVGNNGGRPPIYDNAESLQKECDDYFDYIKGEIDEDQKVIRQPEPATVTGLALFLGFSGRKVLHDYAEKEEFSYIIKRAISKVEQAYEFGLHMQGCTGAIFALKNMGWKDKSEVENSGNLIIQWAEEKTYAAEPKTD